MVLWCAFLQVLWFIDPWGFGKHRMHCFAITTNGREYLDNQPDDILLILSHHGCVSNQAALGNVEQSLFCVLVQLLFVIMRTSYTGSMQQVCARPSH